MRLHSRSLPALLWCAMLLLGMTAHGGAAQSLSLRSSSPASATLTARMDAFLQAVRSGSADNIAQFFPRQGEWTYRRTTHRAEGDLVGTWTFRASDTRPAIDRGPLTDTFRANYEGQAIGSFIHQLRHRAGRWEQFPNRRFVPPGGTQSSHTFVTWRVENGEWVISLVGDEAFGRGQLPAWCC